MIFEKLYFTDAVSKLFTRTKRQDLKIGLKPPEQFCAISEYYVRRP